tara:strand:+ start:85 stop:474 length:390 start_codon:yes stop_codon:yes gene_type:complete
MVKVNEKDLYIKFLESQIDAKKTKIKPKSKKRKYTKKEQIKQVGFFDFLQTDPKLKKQKQTLELQKLRDEEIEHARSKKENEEILKLKRAKKIRLGMRYGTTREQREKFIKGQRLAKSKIYKIKKLFKK